LKDWTSYAIYNDSNHSFDNYSVADIEFGDTINPGGVATWNGNVSAFEDRGGKIITFHGRSDQV
jgi:feruloyl esterase